MGGSELELRRDGRFACMLAYGALDELASGCWSRKGGVVTLKADKFETSMDDPMKFERLELTVTPGGKLKRRFDPETAGAYFPELRGGGAFGVGWQSGLVSGRIGHVEYDRPSGPDARPGLRAGLRRGPRPGDRPQTRSGIAIPVRIVDGKVTFGPARAAKLGAGEPRDGEIVVGVVKQGLSPYAALTAVEKTSAPVDFIATGLIGNIKIDEVKLCGRLDGPSSTRYRLRLVARLAQPVFGRRRPARVPVTPRLAGRPLLVDGVDRLHERGGRDAEDAGIGIAEFEDQEDRARHSNRQAPSQLAEVSRFAAAATIFAVA